MKQLVLLMLISYDVMLCASERKYVQQQFTVPIQGGYILIVEYVDGTRKVTRYSHSYGERVIFVEAKERQGNSIPAEPEWKKSPVLASIWSNNPEERRCAQDYQCYHGDCDG